MMGESLAILARVGMLTGKWKHHAPLERKLAIPPFKPRVKIKMESNILEFERLKGPFISGFTED